MPPGPRKEPRYTFLVSQKSQQTNPLQVPQQGPYGEGGPFTGHSASLSKPSSFRFSSKVTLLQGPLLGIPHREMPHHYSPPSFIHQSPRYMRPPPHIPGSPQMERAPHGVSLVPLHVMAGSRHSAHCYSNLLQVLSPCILVQSIIVNIRFFLNIFEDAGNISMC